MAMYFADGTYRLLCMDTVLYLSRSRVLFIFRTNASIFPYPSARTSQCDSFATARKMQWA